MCTCVYNLNLMAPNLKSIRVYFCYDVMFFRLLLNSQSLTTVHFSLSTPFPEIQKVNMLSVLCNLPDLASLSVDGYFLQSCIAENIPKWLSHAAKRLKTLTIYDLNFGDLYHIQSALCFLQNSPNLERLTVEAWVQRRHYMHLDVNMHLDVKQAQTYLEASGSFNQTLRRLKTIIITRVLVSRPLLLFVKLLLNHSPALEMISIRPSVTAAADVRECHNFKEDITRFPRASSKAELLFLDP
ncbi:F-box/FBD/LRR-repeat protein At1g13570-like [Rutidosis leptorrhynchoides]|uniref:F-box/FBD/LRR-repeat protein At1g13570-like n=1 Tax=Rutidosis leptorrhynchoides TaxID=125765 RepID=UPI003A99B2C5